MIELAGHDYNDTKEEHGVTLYSEYNAQSSVFSILTYVFNKSCMFEQLGVLMRGRLVILHLLDRQGNVRFVLIIYQSHYFLCFFTIGEVFFRN